MKPTVPLLQHPEFFVIYHQGWHEYRVYSPGRANKLWLDVSLVLGIAFCWNKAVKFSLDTAIVIFVLLLYLYWRLTTVLWESVVILPSLGLQLETHRGIADYSLLVARKFVPWSSLEDFLINEGIRGWDIRYYLVAIVRAPQDDLKLEVAFETILPRFPILLEVYHGVQEALQNENERNTYVDE